jgi:hypothetical protein
MTKSAPPPFTCKACGASLDGVPEGGPCPVCGSTERQKNLSAGAIFDAIAVVDSVSVSIGHPQVPTWATLWAQIERRMTRLRELYDPASKVSTAVMEDEIDALLTCLNHLGDWLQHDDTLPAFEKETVEAGMTASAPLALCRDYVNTFKHHTREETTRNPDPRVARVESTTMDASGQSAQISHWSKSDPEHAQRIDALKLAAQCYDAWRAWLTREGVLT